MSETQLPNGEVQEQAAADVVRDQARVILKMMVDTFLQERPSTSLVAAFGLSLGMLMDFYVASGGPKHDEQQRFEEMQAFADALPARIKELVINGVMTRYGVTGERPS